MDLATRRQLDLRLKSCTQCRRRKQKCLPGVDPTGPCTNCTKRYPPVTCIRRSGYFKDGNTLFSNNKRSGLDARLKSNRTPYNVQDHVQEAIDHANKQWTFRRMLSENPKQFGGTLADINTANIYPVDPNAQNARLLYFYIQQLTPRMASLDGQNTPSVLQNAILPLMMQSSLIPKIAVFEAAGFQEIFRTPDIAETRRMIALKGEILANVNTILKDFNKTYREAMHCVLHLVVLEYNWGNYNSIMAHIDGLKNMIKLRGGSIQKLHSPLLTKLLIAIDFETACCYEQDLSIIKPQDVSGFTSSQCPESFENPFHYSGAPFATVLAKLNLSPPLAAILDDLRRLTSLVTNFFATKSDSNAPTHQQQSIIISNDAIRIQKSALSLPAASASPYSPSDLISEIIRITAIVYSTALTLRLPISFVYSPAQRLKVYDAFSRISLSDWKIMPGVYVWALMVATPGSGTNVQGRLLRFNQTLAVICMKLRDFGFMVDCLRTFWRVQRWIVGDIGKGEEGRIGDA